MARLSKYYKMIFLLLVILSNLSFIVAKKSEPFSKRAETGEFSLIQKENIDLLRNKFDDFRTNSVSKEKKGDFLDLLKKCYNLYSGHYNLVYGQAFDNYIKQKFLNIISIDYNWIENYTHCLKTILYLCRLSTIEEFDAQIELLKKDTKSAAISKIVLDCFEDIYSLKGIRKSWLSSKNERKDALNKIKASEIVKLLDDQLKKIQALNSSVSLTDLRMTAEKKSQEARGAQNNSQAHEQQASTSAAREPKPERPRTAAQQHSAAPSGSSATSESSQARSSSSSAGQRSQQSQAWQNQNQAQNLQPETKKKLQEKLASLNSINDRELSWNTEKTNRLLASVIDEAVANLIIEMIDAWNSRQRRNIDAWNSRQRRNVDKAWRQIAQITHQDKVRDKSEADQSKYKQVFILAGSLHEYFKNNLKA